MHLGQVAAGVQGRVVNGLKDLLVQLLRRLAVKGHAQQQEGVREALHADADGAVAHVGAARRLHGVVVDVDDLVQVVGDHPGDLRQLVKVKVALGGVQAANELLVLVPGLVVEDEWG
jgi:hypothetical protein